MTAIHRHPVRDRPRHTGRRWPGRSAHTLQLTLGLLASLGLCAAACSRQNTVPGAPGPAITPTSAVLSPGATARFRTDLPPPVSWQVVEGADHGVVTSDGDYQAPYFPANNPIATVRAYSGGSHADALVTLLNGPWNRDVCFGSAQSHLPSYGESVPEDEPPEAIVRVPPFYPDAARESGVQGRVLVAALVCTSGRVISTSMVLSIPMLDGAAEQAVRQWVFRPARAGGEPVAVWVVVPVQFTLH